MFFFIEGLKYLSGIACCSGVAASSYYGLEYLFPMKPTKNYDVFLLGTLSDISSDNGDWPEMAEDEEEEKDGEEKKTPKTFYKCKFVKESTSIIDENCKLVKIPLKQHGAWQDLKTVSGEAALAKKSDLVEKRYFKVKLRKTFLDAINWDGTQTIEIVSKNSSATADKTKKNEKKEEEKKYAKMKLEYLMKSSWTKGNWAQGTTNSLIVKSTEISKKTTSTSTNPFKCKIVSDEASEDCDLYKLNVNPSSRQTYKQMNWHRSTKLEKSEDIKVGDFFVLRFTKNSKKLSQLYGSKVSIICGSSETEEGQTIANLSAISPITTLSADLEISKSGQKPPVTAVSNNSIILF